MLKILFITPNLDYCGAVKQLTLLATGLRLPGFECHVSSLAEGAAAKALRSVGVNVHLLGWRRWFDLNPLRRLRQLVETLRPDVIHAWGVPSLRAALVASRRGAARLVVSAVPRSPKPNVLHDRFLQVLLRRADAVVPATELEADRYAQLGLPSSKIILIRRGVESRNGSLNGERAEACRALGLPGNIRLLACAGPLEPGKGHRDAIWAFDILKHLYEDLHLLVIGDGSARAKLEEFVHAIRVQASVHFVGRQTDTSSLLAHAEVVWVPSRIDRGCNVALEAMAGGRPVVACRTPGLAEIVVEGKTGFLVALGDKVGLARQARVILEQPERGRQMGEAGRERVHSCYSAAALLDHFARLYEGKAR